MSGLQRDAHPHVTVTRTGSGSGKLARPVNRRCARLDLALTADQIELIIPANMRVLVAAGLPSRESKVPLAADVAVARMTRSGVFTP